jgi:hypothetical protein
MRLVLRMVWVFSLCFSFKGPFRLDTFNFSCLSTKDDGTFATLFLADGLRAPEARVEGSAEC